MGWSDYSVGTPLYPVGIILRLFCFLSRVSPEQFYRHGIFNIDKHLLKIKFLYIKQNTKLKCKFIEYERFNLILLSI